MPSVMRLLFVLLCAHFLGTADTSLAQPPKAGKETRPKALRGHKPPRGAAGAGVRQMFAQAQELFNAGKYQEALARYDAILRRYPGHEPSVIQLAKTLYRLDRIQESYQIFTRVNPQYLDPDTSYEYGYAFYAAKQWDGAFFAFRRVPPGHALYDLANYYGALAAIQLKKYADAEDMLDKAVVLPDKLSRSRSLYQKHVQSLRLMQEKSDLSKARQQEKDRLNQPPGSGRQGKGQDVGSATVNKGYEHQGFQSVDRVAKILAKKTDQLMDRHGYSEQTASTQTAGFSFNAGPLVPLPLIMDGGRQAALGLQINLGAEDNLTKGKTQRILLEEEVSDIPRIQTTTDEDVHYKAGTGGLVLWAESPMPKGFWASILGDANFIYPDFKKADRSGTWTAYHQLGHKAAANNIKFVSFLKVGHEEVLDPNNKPSVQILNSEIETSTEFISNTKVGVGVLYKSFTYDDETIDGPDSTIGGRLFGVQKLPFGSKIDLKMTMQNDDNYIFHGLPTFGNIAASGTTMTAKLALKVEPVSWLTLDVSQLFSKSTWSVDNPETQDPFEKNVPDFLSEFSAGGSINFVF